MLLELFITKQTDTYRQMIEIYLLLTLQKVYG